MGDPVVRESWDIPRALSNEALRLLTTLPMDEIERRLRVPVADSVPVARLPENVQVIEPANGSILVPVPSPIPVDERLPEDQLCWWFESDEDCGYGSNWTLLRIRGSATGYTHWLPAHALPLPEVE